MRGGEAGDHAVPHALDRVRHRDPDDPGARAGRGRAVGRGDKVVRPVQLHAVQQAAAVRAGTAWARCAARRAARRRRRRCTVRGRGRLPPTLQRISRTTGRVVMRHVRRLGRRSRGGGGARRGRLHPRLGQGDLHPATHGNSGPALSAQPSDTHITRTKTAPTSPGIPSVPRCTRLCPRSEARRRWAPPLASDPVERPSGVSVVDTQTSTEVCIAAQSILSHDCTWSAPSLNCRGSYALCPDIAARANCGPSTTNRAVDHVPATKTTLNAGIISILGSLVCLHDC